MKENVFFQNGLPHSYVYLFRTTMNYKSRLNKKSLSKKFKLLISNLPNNTHDARKKGNIFC